MIYNSTNEDDNLSQRNGKMVGDANVKKNGETYPSFGSTSETSEQLTGVSCMYTPPGFQSSVPSTPCGCTTRRFYK